MVRLSMVSVRIVKRKATKYLVIISGMSLICPFWVSRVSFILECVNSSVSIQTANTVHLQNNRESKFSVIADALEDARLSNTGMH